ncbi:RNA polymerase sigma factor [Arthrobacter sp.]|uniref:RNA polymerase sigma factor n=1 Tax=Arthrobacter sp. TaxID=1667 RepID=UPI0026DF745A|nr:RNA polymerase sigma factor [Arthrobacter sp.]MDO5751551.1 RNA polymerase sigma factor [Arthrobacter sp.]
MTRHGPAVLRVCRALVGVLDADDVWQETFVAALRAYPSSGNVRNFEAWLVTIARNKAVDHHRKAGRLPLLTAGSPEFGVDAGLLRPVPGSCGGDDGQGGRDGVVRAVEAGETAGLVWAALAKLPPTQRGAVVYHHLAGLKYVDVAALLGNSEAAARRAAADGMKALRTLLAPSEGMEHDG